MTTPLHVAAALDHADVVALILKKIPSSSVDLMTCTPWQPALPSPAPLLHINMLVRHHGIGGWDKPSTTALHTAIASRASDRVILDIIRAGAAWDLPLANAHGITALHLMAAHGRISLLHSMSSLGIKGLDWPDHQGFRALHYATCYPPAGTDTVAASELIDALVGVGATLEPLNDEEQNQTYLTNLITAASRHNEGQSASSLVDVDGTLPGRPWLPTDLMTPSGAVIDVDEELLLDVQNMICAEPARLAQLEGKTALAEALQSACNAVWTERPA
ncbi:hypothetical protein CkaCkLH20_12235 [Colletotrichum karsti]|uniref:Ankyrin repeat protein n=1 Tax=Colletotrichum karsti TaxID=1095194 RepID=A0A9P6LEM8_9PEZI|nr:uncharacterized protein CkaCkLH20_12235 [Colletotrichum karsti]KAF9870271.1 hypothetical protein CkaCkLH20_12235 [Colletotrichum karsti]